MLKENYGLTVSSLKQLNGYDDLNYHVKTLPAYCNPHIDSHRPEGYFLKISNLKDSRQPELLNAQRSVMDHLISKGIVCQDAIKGINGEVFTNITSAKSGKTVTYAASLRSFLPGRVIAGLTLTASLLFQLGEFAAKVTDALLDFNVPYYETFEHLWNLSKLPKVSEVVFAVKDEKKRKICEEVIKCFETQVLPKGNTFRLALIHGDMNEHNVLLDTDPSSKSGLRISGLLDFQDCAKSYPVYDIALFISYMLMMGTSEVPQEDIPGHMLAGYSSISKLPPEERSVLRICIAGRMVMSLVYGAYTYHLDPTNEYVLETAKFGWQALTEFWQADAQKSEDRWNEIIKQYE
ncbi:hydroxylysine kinase [Elysia marginata]|uniref:Hydroxylysine kinase n=1 Tax=Elysia marginata TaxID=1093978 RepID=A0AAV4HT69_9GAST|nr:hydroxylysine kinase [Elysia marginata]